MSGEPVVFVLRHTHWDREWYHPAAVFRKRLVDLIDDLLGEAPNAAFLLDGQAIVLRDYLTVRPERAAELASALQSARLEAGPWFVLPDELIPSGEALVRNLLAGRRTLRSLRAAAPPVLYCPDSFGHPAALPAIAAGFGYSTIVLWRGYGSRRFPPGDAARWVAPNGDAALLFHLPPDGYEFGSNLPAAAHDAQRRWDSMRAVLAARSTLGVLLVPNGADHHAPQRNADAAISALTKAAAPLKVELGGLTRLAELLEARATTGTLSRVQGELRDSHGYTWTLSGTLGTRAHQKRANARLERALIRDVEPWTALARLYRSQSVRHHVTTAWEALLACHPHDSLCGCSIDAVAQAVDARLAEATAMTTELRAGSLSKLLGQDANASRSQLDTWQCAVIVRNRAARPRGGVAEIELDVALAHVPVGPGSAGGTRELPRRDALSVPTQLLSRERRYARIEAPGFYPINYEVERRRSLIWLPSVPAYGLAPLPVTESGSRTQFLPELGVKADARSVRSNLGTLTNTGRGLTWRGARSVVNRRPLFDLEIERDRGDLYTPSAVPGTRGRAMLRTSRVTLRGPLRGAIESSWRAATSGRASRATVDVRTQAALDAGASFIRVAVSGVNEATDHRLRIVFQTGLRPRRVLADAAFAFVERKPLRVPAADRRAESPTPTAPLHRFVSVFDAKRGCTVVSDGLAEYEVLERGGIAITLVRAVAQLSRNDIPERPGHAGWPEATPNAQCIGPFAAEFAIAWHGPDDATTRAHIVTLVDDVLLPLTGETRRDLITPPQSISGIELAGRGLQFSALKESEDGRGVIARCVNVTSEELHGAWVLPRDVAAAHMARLDETLLEPLEVRGRRIEIVVPPHGISTVAIRLEADSR